MEALNKILTAVNETAAEYIEKTKQPVESIELTEPMNTEQLDALMVQGILPGVKWDELNREQKRRAKKVLHNYKKKMNLL